MRVHKGIRAHEVNHKFLRLIVVKKNAKLYYNGVEAPRNF
jgi:hypothetical protein